MKGRGGWPFIDLLPQVPMARMVPGDIIVFRTAFPDLLIYNVEEPDGWTKLTWFEIGSSLIRTEVLKVHDVQPATYSVLRVLRSGD